MNKRIKQSLMYLAALFIAVQSLNIFAQDNEYNASFSIYTNNMYSSSQDVSINLNAYGLKKKPEFTFKVYKIRDLEAFFSRQTSTYTIDVLSKDSTNLLSLCDESDSFDKSFKTEGSEN